MGGEELKIDSIRKPLICTLDDDEFTSSLLKRQLERRKYSCVAFLRSSDLLSYLENSKAPDVFILDYHLGYEGHSGLDLCRKIKGRYRVPAVMLTANSEVETVVNCLNAGADQYLVKPYKIEELIARVEAVLRLYPDRAEMDRQRARLQFPVKIDWAERKLIGRDGSTIRLTEKELSLLELFIAAGDRLLDREKSFAAIYDKEMDPFNRAIDILVSRLRKKLMAVAPNSDIMTVRGRGYLLVIPQTLHEEGGER